MRTGKQTHLLESLNLKCDVLQGHPVLWIPNRCPQLSALESSGSFETPLCLEHPPKNSGLWSGCGPASFSWGSAARADLALISSGLVALQMGKPCVVKTLVPRDTALGGIGRLRTSCSSLFFTYISLPTSYTRMVLPEAPLCLSQAPQEYSLLVSLRILLFFFFSQIDPIQINFSFFRLGDAFLLKRNLFFPPVV